MQRQVHALRGSSGFLFVHGKVAPPFRAQCNTRRPPPTLLMSFPLLSPNIVSRVSDIVSTVKPFAEFRRRSAMSMTYFELEGGELCQDHVCMGETFCRCCLHIINA